MRNSSEQQKQVLAKAAQNFTDGFKEPAILLQWLTETLTYFHNYSRKNVDSGDYHFNLIIFLKDVYPVWLSGGDIVTELENLSDFFGSADHLKAIAEVNKAYCHDLSQNGTDTQEDLERMNQGFMTMYTLGRDLLGYELAENEKGGEA